VLSACARYACPTPLPRQPLASRTCSCKQHDGSSFIPLPFRFEHRGRVSTRPIQTRRLYFGRRDGPRNSVSVPLPARLYRRRHCCYRHSAIASGKEHEPLRRSATARLGAGNRRRTASGGWEKTILTKSCCMAWLYWRTCRTSPCGVVIGPVEETQAPKIEHLGACFAKTQSRGSLSHPNLLHAPSTPKADGAEAAPARESVCCAASGQP
jgi:hypothetical protein